MLFNVVISLMSYSCAALEVDPNKDIVCQLCGAWFETRKGLSSHARAHLRHFGVEYSESKGSPIDLLNKLIETDEFKHKASALQLDSHPVPRGLTTTLPSPKQSSLLSLSSSSSSSLLYKVATSGGGSSFKPTSPSASLSLGPPAKRPKSSSMRVFHLSSGELMPLPHSEYLFLDQLCNLHHIHIKFAVSVKTSSGFDWLLLMIMSLHIQVNLQRK